MFWYVLLQLGGHININMVSYLYRNSHCGDNIVVRSPQWELLLAQLKFYTKSAPLGSAFAYHISYLINYAHCSFLLCFEGIRYPAILSIIFRVSSLALGQSYDWPSVSEAMLNIMVNSLRPSDAYIYIYIGNSTIIGSENGLWPGQHQAIIWTNGGILLILPIETNFSEFLITILKVSFKQMHWKGLSMK